MFQFYVGSKQQLHFSVLIRASLAKCLGVRLGSKWFRVRAPLQARKLQISRLFGQEIPWHSDNYRVWIDSKMRTWHDMNIQL